MAAKSKRTAGSYPRNKTYVVGVYHGQTNNVEEWEVKGYNVVYIVDGVEQIFLNVVNSHKQVVYSINSSRLAYLYLKGSSVITKSGAVTKAKNVVAGIKAIKAVE